MRLRRRRGAVVPPPLMRRLGRADERARTSRVWSAGRAARWTRGDWKAHSAYAAWSTSREGVHARCFWRCVEAIFTDEERLEVVQFATGLAAVPAGVFKNLVGYMGDQAPFTVGELPPPRRDEPGRGGGGARRASTPSGCRGSGRATSRKKAPGIAVLPRGRRWTGARRWRGAPRSRPERRTRVRRLLNTGVIFFVFGGVIEGGTPAEPPHASRRRRFGWKKNPPRRAACLSPGAGHDIPHARGAPFIPVAPLPSESLRPSLRVRPSYSQSAS